MSLGPNLKGKFVKHKITAFLLLVLVFTGCYVRHPRYSSVHAVMKIRTGMQLNEVDSILGTSAYDMVSFREDGTKKLLYKYRLEDIKRVPVIMKKTKGVPTEGSFMDMIVVVDANDVITSVETSPERVKSKHEKTKIDTNALISSVTMLITVTIPSVLVFLSATN